MSKVLLSIIRKEFWHIMRDPQTLTIIILMPVVMLFLFGYAITLDMKEIDTIIIDQSKTPQSRQFIEQIVATDFFQLVAVDINPDRIETYFQQRKARCALIIPNDFGRAVQKQPATGLQLLVDASDPNAANYIHKYFTQQVFRYNQSINDISIIPFQVESRMLYNPNLRSAYFFVPGLIAVILLLISALLTSIAIVREKELGTMEQILVSPVHPFQIIVGKAIPYTVLGFLDSLIILIVARFWFDVPMEGSIVLLGMALILYILTGLSFGLLISTVTHSQRLAMMAALLSTILPTIMLSGFIFPIKSMPVLFQWISNIIPATHFLQIIRGIMLKGIGFMELYSQMGYLVLLAVLLIALSVKKFSKTLE
ncbi:MAG: ABC transporter permease subunit [Caldithrix sp.]|nr:ABC transporter permease subunit [Caldithrix sp.]